MTSIERIVAALDGHPWLTRTWAADAGVLLLLNACGVAELQREGRQALLDQLLAQLTRQGLSSPREWRLLDTMPGQTDAATVAQRLQMPRPKVATPITEHPLDGGCKLSLRLPLDLLHFDGHFRQAPVLPGVMQVSFALALAAPRLGTSTRCREMEALKFQRLLRPGELLELTLRYVDDPGAERGKLEFAYHFEGAHCSSGRLRVARAHD